MALRPWKYVSLFSGGGGLDLAVKLAFKRTRCVLYVEREISAAAELVARIEEGCLDDAPIWSDCTTADYGRLRGKVDGVLAGWPCPPVSVAGKRKGVEDERWLWPEVWRAIRETGASWLVGENVPGLLTGNGGAAFGSVLSDLDEGGFRVEWTSLSAAQVGASHKRERVFLLAHAHGQQRRGCHGEPGHFSAASGREMGIGVGLADAGQQCLSGRSQLHSGGMGGETAAIEGSSGQRQRLRDAAGDGGAAMELAGSDGPQGQHCPRRWPGAVERTSGDAMADAACIGEREPDDETGSQPSGREPRQDAGRASLPIAPPGPADFDAWRSILAVRPDLTPAVEPPLRGVADDGADRMDLARADRLRSLGNMVVPLQAAAALTVLHQQMMETL